MASTSTSTSTSTTSLSGSGDSSGVKDSTSTWDIKGKTVIITGGSSGIGEYCAQELYSRGAHVHLFLRNLEKGVESVKNIESTIGAPDSENRFKISLQKCDLNSLESVKLAAQTFKESNDSLHVLLNNAGIFDVPTRRMTKDGFEQTFGVNHLSHFLLTNMLLDVLIKSQPSRIVTVSSSRHYGGDFQFDDLQYKSRSYSPKGAYALSKLCNAAFSFELAAKLRKIGNAEHVSTYALHPGVIKTNLFDSQPFYVRFAVNYLIGISVPEGAQTSLYCITDPDVGKTSGLFFNKSKPVDPNPQAVDPKLTSRLWDVSMDLLGLPKDTFPLKDVPAKLLPKPDLVIEK